ncbi:hypothetical protein EYE35_01345 [Cereibacter sphaeroides]|nr:hypothetical protein EYE35_01345 [Cereibacter sphaeroides]
MTEIDMSTGAVERLAETLLFRGHHHQEKINHLLRRLHVERITASKTLRALAAERDRLREAVVEMERSPEYWHGRALKAEASLTEARAETGALIERAAALCDEGRQVSHGMTRMKTREECRDAILALSPDATAAIAEVRRAERERCAELIDKRREAYQAEHGIYDLETGATEYPGNGDEWVQEWHELAEAIRTPIEKEPDGLRGQVLAIVARVNADYAAGRIDPREVAWINSEDHIGDAPKMVPQPAAADGWAASLAAGVAEQMAQQDGAWVSCSGCYATDEGYPTAATDPVFGCALGGGCMECGGLGAVWDAPDYRDVVAEAAAEPSPPTVAEAARVLLASGRLNDLSGWDGQPFQSAMQHGPTTAAHWRDRLRALAGEGRAQGY